MPVWEQLDKVIPTRLWMTTIKWVLRVGVPILKVELFISSTESVIDEGETYTNVPAPVHVCARGCDPFWSPHHLCSTCVPPSLTHTSTTKEQGQPLGILLLPGRAWGESWVAKELPLRDRGLNEMGGGRDMSVVAALLPLLGRAKTWALDRPVPADVGLPRAGHVCPSSPSLGACYPLGDPCPCAALPHAP